ncbi:MAG: hypothetical protein KGI27_02250 [Thaumarchaeota archaeon]|nr:hypothetical protein [Nitrososphaerota archaeon]
MLRDEFKETLSYTRSIHPSLPIKATLIDPVFMRDAVISNESFLRNQKLLGGDSSEDVIKILHILTKFNTQITGFNNSHNTEEKRELLAQIYSPSFVLFSELSTVEPVLNKVIKICEETLKKYE